MDDERRPGNNWNYAPHPKRNKGGRTGFPTWCISTWALRPSAIIRPGMLDVIIQHHMINIMDNQHHLQLI